MNLATQAASTARGAIRPGSYTGENKVPAVIALWLILVLIAAGRNRALPDQKHTIALAVATVFVALAAAVAPKFAFYVLLAAVVVIAATNSDTVVNYVDAGSAKLRAALA